MAAAHITCDRCARVWPITAEPPARVEHLHAPCCASVVALLRTPPPADEAAA